ncbi:MAG: hypothetical protein OEY63_02290 [Gemmatimonadota bacterium]|nr:hypothetical protein [Gemmatimonadota bacterium]
MNRLPWPVLFGALMLVGNAEAQGYRIRFDTGFQSVAFRGVAIDSVLATDAVVGSTGGFETSDGYAVRCITGLSYCTFFRPGPIRRAAPLATSTNLTMWGLGVSGLTLRLNSRFGIDVGDGSSWPGTSPASQLIAAYAEYSKGKVRAQLGRTHVWNRFGWKGLDGARVDFNASRNLRVNIYGGWGLARASAVPVTSPALNPLDDFQPGARGGMFGAEINIQSSLLDVSSTYQREIDLRTGQQTAERVGVQGNARLNSALTLSGGVDYDVTFGEVGNADIRVLATAPRRMGTFTAGARRYRPHFPLWTIWGAFSPAPYTAVFGSALIRPIRGLVLSARGERYEYLPTGAGTPLMTNLSAGWRWGADLSYAAPELWRVDASMHRQLGPGAGSAGLNGRVTLDPFESWRMSVHGGLMERPLEFRFDDADVWSVGADVAYSPAEMVRIRAGAVRYDETRVRPDAAQFSWNQFRLFLDASISFGSDDRPSVPPAVLRIPNRRIER